MSFGITFNFINMFPKNFKTNYLRWKNISCEEMYELSNKISVTLKEPLHCKKIKDNCY